MTDLRPMLDEHQPSDHELNLRARAALTRSWARRDARRRRANRLAAGGCGALVLACALLERFAL